MGDEMAKKDYGKVDRRGRVSIPKWIRDIAGIVEEDDVAFRAKPGEVRVIKAKITVKEA